MTGKMYYITSSKWNVRGGQASGIGLSFIPGLIYSQIIAQRFLTPYAGGTRILLMLLCIGAYMAVSQVRYLCIPVAVANAVMYIGMIWIVMDKIDLMWLRIAFKVAAAIITSLMELGICSNIMKRKR